MSTGEATESSAAMSLWQKFAELQNTADALRTERRRVEGKSERLKDDLQRMKREMESELSNMESEADDVDTQSSEDLNANAEYSSAVKAKNDAQLSLEQWKAWKQEEMESNMAYERSFRLQCEQWKLRAMAVGLDNAIVEAAVFSKDPTIANLNSLTSANITSTQLGNDPLLWDISNDDEELTVAVERYRNQINERNSIEKTVEENRSTLQTIVDKQIASDHRSADFQKRLEAILGESKGLQASLAEVEELILHEEALVGTYSKSAFLSF